MRKNKKSTESMKASASLLISSFWVGIVFSLFCGIVVGFYVMVAMIVLSMVLFVTSIIQKSQNE